MCAASAIGTATSGSPRLPVAGASRDLRRQRLRPPPAAAATFVSPLAVLRRYDDERPPSRPSSQVAHLP
eukprot:7430822-Pyramimonas_sp.AAC.1